MSWLQPLLDALMLVLLLLQPSSWQVSALLKGKGLRCCRSGLFGSPTKNQLSLTCALHL